MAKKKVRIKREVQRKVEMKRDMPKLSKDKAEGIMAIMAVVLIVLSAILDQKVSLTIAVVLMIMYAAYKLIFKK